MEHTGADLHGDLSAIVVKASLPEKNFRALWVAVHRTGELNEFTAHPRAVKGSTVNALVCSQVLLVQGIRRCEHDEKSLKFVGTQQVLDNEPCQLAFLLPTRPKMRHARLAR